MINLYGELKSKTLQLCRRNHFLDEKIIVRARSLSSEEAIGNPEGDDFPLQKGKERLMQAGFREAFGQAFTDRFGDFEGTLKEIFHMPLDNNYRRAVFVAALNAVLRHLGLIEGTIHCHDQGPAECAVQMASHIRRQFGRVKVTQVGYQPCIVETLARTFPFRLLDLDPENIGQEKFGSMVEGPEATGEAVDWAELLLVTGTTLTNNTVGRFLIGKPVIFYGTTIASAAYLMGWNRFCSKSK